MKTAMLDCRMLLPMQKGVCIFYLNRTIGDRKINCRELLGKSVTVCINELRTLD